MSVKSPSLVSEQTFSVHISGVGLYTPRPGVVLTSIESSPGLTPTVGVQWINWPVVNTERKDNTRW